MHDTFPNAVQLDVSAYKQVHKVGRHQCVMVLAAGRDGTLWERGVRSVVPVVTTIAGLRCKLVIRTG